MSKVGNIVKATILDLMFVFSQILLIFYGELKFVCLHFEKDAKSTGALRQKGTSNEE